MAQIETYTNDSGTWGYGPRGGLFCSTCGGRTTVPCPRTYGYEGPYDEGDGLGRYWMCGDCDEPIYDPNGRRGHERVHCPTCER
jgi:hydrogenase maturation factor HypF (carbamoyltransferase family)